MMKENREPKFTDPPPPFLTEIRKMHYVCIYIYIYDKIHKYETLNVNKVNSKENTGSFKALTAKQTQQVRATRSTTGFEGAETKNDG